MNEQDVSKEQEDSNINVNNNDKLRLPGAAFLGDRQQLSTLLALFYRYSILEKTQVRSVQGSEAVSLTIISK